MSLICLSLKYIEDLSKQELFRLANLVYPFLQNDSHLPWEKEQINEVIEVSLSVLIKLKLIYKTESGSLRKLKEKGQNYQHYLALSNLCESTIKRIYIVMNTLWTQEKISIKDLQNNCISVANSLQKIEGWLYSEDKDSIKVFASYDKDEDTNEITFGDRTMIPLSCVKKMVKI